MVSGQAMDFGSAEGGFGRGGPILQNRPESPEEREVGHVVVPFQAVGVPRAQSGARGVFPQAAFSDLRWQEHRDSVVAMPNLAALREGERNKCAPDVPAKKKR